MKSSDLFTAKDTSLRESTSSELFCVKIRWESSFHGGARKDIDYRRMSPRTRSDIIRFVQNIIYE